MDGYSVAEAAQVLGIPEARVWELIARGVLFGASEGRDDMRVFLRPPAGSAAFPAPPAAEGSPRSNGGDGSQHVEASPFRELLTEFRNLTERYGQALLALGEARGEVASLRSRVDLLEARMDMRLPMRSASTVAWELPDRYAAERAAPDAAPAAAAAGVEATPDPMPAPEPMPVPEAPAEPSAADEPAEPAEPAEQAGSAEPTEPEEPPAVPAPERGVNVVVHAGGSGEQHGHRRRVTGGRAAVAGLAEALARAEDPTLADLPGAREAGEALAALQRKVETPLPAEDEEPVAEVQAAFAPAIEAVEAALPGADDDAASLAPAKDLAPRTEVAPPGHLSSAEPEVAVTEVEPPAPAEDVPPAQLPRPYTTEVVEPDWFADGDFAWLDAPQAGGHDIPEVTMDDEPPTAPAESVAKADAQADAAAPRDELDHIRDEDEAPAVEALQDAFEKQAPPTADPAEPIEGPIQAAFDEPDAAHAPTQPSDADAADAHGPPDSERPSITGSQAVGFNLFREPATAVTTSDDPVEFAATDAPAETPHEEALLWFGDEFDVAELEAAGAGWRDPAAPAPPTTVAPDPVRADATTPAPADVEAAPMDPEGTSDADIARLAANEGWSADEIEAMRAYLGRGDEAEPHPDTASGAADHPLPPASPNATALPGPLDQDWLRGRRGPAATAYRRLRRLLQS